MPDRIGSCNAIQCHVMWYHAMSCHIMSHRTVCHVLSCPVLSCPILSYHIIPGQARPRRVPYRNKTQQERLQHIVDITIYFNVEALSSRQARPQTVLLLTHYNYHIIFQYMMLCHYVKRGSSRAPGPLARRQRGRRRTGRRRTGRRRAGAGRASGMYMICTCVYHIYIYIYIYVYIYTCVYM